jgi:hypothetical protein
LRDRAINIHVLVTNMSDDTRRRLDALGRQARIGFICRDRESIALYRDLIRVQMGNRELDLVCCILSEQECVREVLASADAVLVSPPVYEEIRALAPPELPVFNLFDRVDLKPRPASAAASAARPASPP